MAIGDIHGCDVALEVLLDALQPTTNDTVVILGDVIDRGPDSKRCIELLINLRTSCRLVFLLGNHEEMLFDAGNFGQWAQGWLRYGGTETLQSYGCRVDEIPEEHMEFLYSGTGYYERDESIFVHANLQPGVPLENQNRQWLRWVHLSGNEQPHPSGKRVVCGHTRQASGAPATLDGWVCIDTFACGGKFLTCLDVERDIVYRSTQSGDVECEIPLADIAVPFVPQ